jgi:hypothetical protein
VNEIMGYGCLVAETKIGVVNVCQAADSDIEGFAHKPVLYQWQLIKIPIASRKSATTIGNSGNNWMSW